MIINGQTVSQEALDKILGNKSYIIKEASLKDDYCNYSFEIKSGIGAGDTHSVKGSGVIEDDMRFAFGKLNVHLAFIDDVFRHSGIQIDDIDAFHVHELATLYHVSGFKITGGGEDEQVVLKGSKYISSAGGRIELVTPKIPLDNLSSYPWYNELAEAVQNARHEVELYKEGKYLNEALDEEEEERPAKKGKGKQMKITDVSDEEEDGNDDFENARI